MMNDEVCHLLLVCLCWNLEMIIVDGGGWW
jgi:hypothetical protein